MNCTRCKTGTLSKPYQSGSKWVVDCKSCGKKSGVKRWQTNTGEWQYAVYQLGRRGMGLVHTHRLEEAWSAKLTGDEVRRLLRIGKDALEKRTAF